MPWIIAFARKSDSFAQVTALAVKMTWYFRFNEADTASLELSMNAAHDEVRMYARCANSVQNFLRNKTFGDFLR